MSEIVFKITPQNSRQILPQPPSTGSNVVTFFLFFSYGSTSVHFLKKFFAQKVYSPSNCLQQIILYFFSIHHGIRDREHLS